MSSTKVVTASLPPDSTIHIHTESEDRPTRLRYGGMGLQGSPICARQMELLNPRRLYMAKEGKNFHGMRKFAEAVQTKEVMAAQRGAASPQPKPLPRITRMFADSGLVLTQRNVRVTQASARH